MPVYLFWGEEEFNLKSAVKDLKAKVLDPNWAMLNHKIMIEPDIKDLTEQLQTLPMVFGNLLIEIQASSLFLRGSKKVSSSDSLMKKLLDILENVNPNIYVLFICNIPRDSGKKIDSALKLTKTIEKIGKIQAFDAYKFYQEKEIISWITERAKTKEVKISHEAAEMLLHNTGPELRKLDSELEKLTTSISPEKIISKSVVEALSASHENIFLLADFWLQNNKTAAVVELNKLFEKDHALKIIATLNTIIRRWLKIKIESKHKNSFEVSKSINLHKFVVEKDLEKLRNVSEEKLISFRQKLTKAEHQIKSGELTAEISLELAIMS